MGEDNNTIGICEQLARWLAVLKAKGVLNETDCAYVLGAISTADWLEANDDKLHLEGTNGTN